MLQLTRLKSFVRALWSFLRTGDAPLAEATRREQICNDCPEVVTTATGLFCGACGCAQWAVSDLRTKWRLPVIACPQGKW